MSDESEVDAVLLHRWRSGEAEAGEALHDRHSHAVIRFFRNKVRDGVEDLVHETFVRLIARRDQIRQASAFRAYLLGIARHVLHEHLRELARGRNIDPEVDSNFTLSPGPSTIVARKQEHRLLLEGLRRLPIEHQIALELFYWEGLKAKEIAEIMEVSDSGMRSRLVKARSLLADIIATLGDSTALAGSSVDGLDAWAGQLRAQLDAEGNEEPEG